MSRADDEGFAAFYRVEVELVVRFLIMIGAAVPDAVDAAGLAFTEVRARWGQLVDPRGQLRRIALGYLDGSADLPAHGDVRAFRACWAIDFVVQACERDDVRQMLAALRRLPRREREILAWHRDGYCAGEIAELLGLDVHGVRVSLATATETLRQLRAGDLDWP